MPNISKAMGVAEASISKINGIAKASISKFLGVEAVPPFVPGSATDDNADDLTLWLDADDASEFTTSAGTTNQATKAYYKAEDGSRTTLSDTSDTGNSRHGSITNATWDSSNKALGSYSVSLNGTDAFIDVSAITQDIHNTSWSISFWYKSSATGADKYLFSWTASNGTTLRLGLYWDDSEDQLVYAAAGFSHEKIVTPKNIQDDEWHHIVQTYDGTDLVTYVDGEIDIYYGSWGSISRASDDKLYLGRYDSTYLAANYDEIAIWAQALTLTQVQELYNNGTPISDADLVKDEKLISQWSDKSGNDYHFTQSTANQKPRLTPAAAGINSKPVVRFTEDANDQMASSATLGNIIDADKYTVFVVFKGRYVTNAITSGTGVFRMHPIISDNDGYWGIHWGYDNHTDPRRVWAYHYDGSNEQTGPEVGALAALATYSAARIYTILYNGSTQSMYVNGNTNAVLNSSNSSVGNVSNVSKALRLGKMSTTQYNALDGDIAEILVYDESLSSADIATVVTYLANKWGITENNSQLDKRALFVYNKGMLISNTSKKTQRTLELAKRVAANSTYGKLKHGAVLVKGGNVVNVAFNKPDFTKFGNRFRNNYTCGLATTHAEIGAILGLSRSTTEGATVFVVRINRHGEYRMSKPCPMCEDVLKFVGVKKVVYTTDGHTVGEHRL